MKCVLTSNQGIVASHKAFNGADDTELVRVKLLEPGIDAADTILQCSQHMKCIVDGRS